ncbi:hypothetical protein MWN41_09515 [Ornithobacterium rhinotracheale]|uniref:hypothetical protein n=1 Tax=Ornithobacterium rhinotracheale TaxID=28251 RepID=UPI001FF47AE4|nr:hypothetical protein [Ornithobacterium rhinotracheale]MCK0203249.1 hypothetical protein [Ornithobacterium rhinotracheale]
MAKSKNNVITHGLSGKIGDLLVFSQRNGKTIVSKVPKKSNKVSDKQKEQTKKFQKAVLYAKNSLQNPSDKQEYELAASKEAGVSGYNIAVADLLNAPKIEKIDLTYYKGKKGDTIKVVATDDFKVVSVSVEIQNSDGTLVEQGEAIEQGLEWVYIAKTNNTDLSGDKIIIRATDKPANMTEETKNL